MSDTCTREKKYWIDSYINICFREEKGSLSHVTDENVRSVFEISALVSHTHEHGQFIAMASFIEMISKSLIHTECCSFTRKKIVTFIERNV